MWIKHQYGKADRALGTAPIADSYAVTFSKKRDVASRSRQRLLSMPGSRRLTVVILAQGILAQVSRFAGSTGTVGGCWTGASAPGDNDQPQMLSRFANHRRPPYEGVGWFLMVIRSIGTIDGRWCWTGASVPGNSYPPKAFEPALAVDDDERGESLGSG